MNPPEADANEKAKIRQEAEQVADKWYYSNSPKANNALNGQNGLRSEYLQHLSHLPSPVPGSKYHRHDGDGRNGDGNGAGAGAGTGSGGAGLPGTLGASHVPRVPDWSSAGGVPDSGESTSPLDKPSDMLGTEPGSDSSELAGLGSALGSGAFGGGLGSGGFGGFPEAAGRGSTPIPFNEPLGTPSDPNDFFARTPTTVLDHQMAWG